MKIISTKKAPQAIGPYSQAVAMSNVVYTSGQVPLDPVTMKIVEGGIEKQTEQVFNNLENVLKATDMDLDNVVKTTVFLANMDEFNAMNAIYENRFGKHKPARSTVQVARLPLDSLVEIECVAFR